MAQNTALNKSHKLLIITLMILSFLLLLFIPVSLRSNEVKDKLPYHAAVFPSKLQHVGEEAFENTSFSKLFFQNELLTIGNKAFYANHGLHEAYLPPSIIYLADTAFERSSLEIIHGIFGSVAHEWADEHGVQFYGNYNYYSAPVLSLFRVGLVYVLFGVIPPIDDRFRSRYKARIYIPSMRPQDRIELYPINYRFP